MADLIHRIKDTEYAGPYAIVKCVSNPGNRYGVGPRILSTLQRMIPKSDESFLTEHSSTAHLIAKANGMTVATRREGDKYRVWRMS